MMISGTRGTQAVAYTSVAALQHPGNRARKTECRMNDLPGDCVIGDTSSWELRHAQMAFLPGAANLLPFLWLMSPTARVRRAAMVAGLIGAAVFALPQAGLIFPFIPGGIASGSLWSCPGSVYVHPLYAVFVLLPATLILWFVSTLLGTVIFFRISRRK